MHMPLCVCTEKPEGTCSVPPRSCPPCFLKCLTIVWGFSEASWPGSPRDLSVSALQNGDHKCLLPRLDFHTGAGVQTQILTSAHV